MEVRKAYRRLALVYHPVPPSGIDLLIRSNKSNNSNNSSNHDRNNNSRNRNNSFFNNNATVKRLRLKLRAWPA